MSFCHIKKCDSTKLTNGFTVVELCVIIVVIGILATIAFVSYGSWKESVIISKLKSDLNGAATAMENARNFSEDGYPASIPPTFSASDSTFLVGGGIYSGRKFCITATDQEDPTIIYHFSSSDGEAKEGRCPIETFIAGWGGVSATDDWGIGIAYTSDDGYVITGETDSYGQGTAGSSDMFIAKYFHDGSVQWSKTWGGSNTDTGTSVIQTSDGGYAVTGTTYSYGEGVVGKGDMFIAKYTSAGELSWSKTWGSVNIEYGYSIVQTNDNGYVVAGSTQVSGAGLDDAFIVKYDSDGDVVWDRIWGSGSYDCGLSVIQTSDGGYAMAGNTRRYSGTKSNDMFIAKYTSTGVLSWSKTWGGAGQDYAYSIVQNSDDEYVLAGRAENLNAGSNVDMFLIKFNSTGNFIKNIIWGSTGNEYGYSVTEMSDGGYAVTGFTTSYGTGGGDIFVARFDSSLNHLWSKTIGGSNSDSGQTVVEFFDGGLAVVGYITDTYGAGGQEAIFAKYNPEGTIVGCPVDFCRNINPSVTSPAGTMDSPSDSNLDPSAIVHSFTALQIATSSPTAVETEIVPLVEE